MADKQSIQIPPLNGTVPDQAVLRANWLNDQQAMLRLRRMKLAQAWDIPLSLIEGGSSMSGRISQRQRSGLGALGAAALTAAAFLGGGAGALGLASFLRAPQAAVTDSPSTINPAEYDLTLEVKDGKLVPVKVEPVK